MKLAITTDWLVTLGGAERVIEEMHELWPEAPLFTTVKGPGCPPVLQDNVRTSPLQKWHMLIRNHRILIPFMPKAVESWDLRGFDVVLSSSHAVAKGCIPQGGARHICYCHTPMRYAWEMEDEYLDDFKVRGPLRALARRELTKMRKWDLTTARRVDQFIANSREVANRIKKIYGRDSIVLSPPVGDHFFEVPLTRERGGYFLMTGRLVPYKKSSLMIELVNEHRLPLKIVGKGPEEDRLKKMAGPTIEFLGRVTDEELQELYRKAEATIFPVHEDAGIVPLESQACGTPVIALRKGGALDTVVDGGTGIFFDEQTTDSLAHALQKFRMARFDPEKIREHTRKFSSERFKEKLREIVEENGKKM